MKRLGQIQIIISIILAICTTFSWMAYRHSIRDFLTNSACVTEEGAELTNLCLQQAHDSCRAIESFRKTCESSQDAVTAIKSYYVATKQQMPGVRKSICDIASDLKTMSGIFSSTGEKINIKVPSGVHFEGMIPALSWSYPLKGAKDSVIELAKQIDNAHNTLVGIDQNVLEKLADPDDKVIVTLDQTLESLKISTSILAKLANTDLPLAETHIKRVSERMRSASKGVGDSIFLFDCITVVIMMMAAMFLVNGIIVTKLATSSSSTQ